MMTLKEYVASKNFPMQPVDNRIHRFDHAGPKSGWFKAHTVTTMSGEQLTYAYFGDWKTGESHAFRSSEDEEADILLAKLEEEVGLYNDKHHRAVAERELKAFKAMEDLTPEFSEKFEYFEVKKIKPSAGLKQFTHRTTTAIYVPLYNCLYEKLGYFCGTQLIASEGEKVFCAGMKSKGAFHMVGGFDLNSLKQAKNIVLCEGYATALSVYAFINSKYLIEGGFVVLAVMNAGNYQAVMKDVRMLNLDCAFHIFADDDRFNETNVGIRKAMKALGVHGGKLYVPVCLDEGTDFNDLWCSGRDDFEAYSIPKGTTDFSGITVVERPRVEVVEPVAVVEPLGVPEPVVLGPAVNEAELVPLELSQDATLVGQGESEGDEGPRASGVITEEEGRAMEGLATALSGFHTVTFSKAGVPKYIPNYTELAIYFGRLHRFKIPLGTENIYGFDGKCYKLLPDSFVNVFAQRHFHPKPNNNTTREFLGFIHRTNDVPNDWFELPKNKINFQNGVLDFVTGKLSPHSEEVGFKYVLPFDYDPEAKCPVFEKVLHKVTCGDETLQKIILEFFGYALSGDSCWAQKALVFDGEGENGKSTIMEVLENLCGKENKSSLTLNEMKNPNDRAALDGKLFNIAEETPSRGLAESSIFKNLVTGGTVRAKLMYKDTFEFKNMAKLILACNQLPASYDASVGFFRRFIIIPFKAKFSKTDPDFDPFIKDKLRHELSGVFNLCLEGYKRLLANRGFTESKVVQEAIESYKDEIDFTRNWFNDCVIVEGVDSAKKTEKTLLYFSYNMWCVANGFKALNSVHFGRRLASIIPNYEARIRQEYPTNKQGKKVRVLRGITIIE